jgi:hypothetical protein
MHNTHIALRNSSQNCIQDYSSSPQNSAKRVATYQILFQPLRLADGQTIASNNSENAPYQRHSTVVRAIGVFSCIQIGIYIG